MPAAARLKPYPAARGWESCGVKFCGLKAAFALGILLCAGNAAWAQLALVPQAKHARTDRGPPGPVVLPQEFPPAAGSLCGIPRRAGSRCRAGSAFGLPG